MRITQAQVDATAPTVRFGPVTATVILKRDGASPNALGNDSPPLDTGRVSENAGSHRTPEGLRSEVRNLVEGS